MSGLEVVMLVTAIVSAYSGTALYLKERKKRKINKAKERTKGLSKLREAVIAAPPQIQREYDHDFARIGPTFATGDAIAQGQLTEILIGLQQNMIVELQTLLLSSSRSVSVDYSSLVNISESSKLESISALAQQYQRFKVAAPIINGTINANFTPQPVEDLIPTRMPRPYACTAGNLRDAVTVTTTRESQGPAHNRSHFSDSTNSQTPSPPINNGPAWTSLFGKDWDRVDRGNLNMKSWDGALAEFARLLNTSSRSGGSEDSQGRLKNGSC